MTFSNSPHVKQQKIFEKLSVGSSYGVYSLLRFNSVKEGYSKFRVMSYDKISRIFKIDWMTLQRTRQRFRRFDRALTEASKALYLSSVGVPFCDFFINHDLIKELEVKARNKLRQRTLHGDLLNTIKQYTTQSFSQ